MYPTGKISLDIGAQNSGFSRCITECAANINFCCNFVADGADKLKFITELRVTVGLRTGL